MRVVIKNRWKGPEPVIISVACPRCLQPAEAPCVYLPPPPGLRNATAQLQLERQGTPKGRFCQERSEIAWSTLRREKARRLERKRRDALTRRFGRRAKIYDAVRAYDQREQAQLTEWLAANRALFELPFVQGPCRCGVGARHCEVHPERSRSRTKEERKAIERAWDERVAAGLARQAEEV